MKPRLSASFWLLCLLAGVGLVALFLAAYHAFAQVMEPYQAGFAALLIEAGMVSEAIALARGNRLAAVGTVISLVVSGTYNYVQVDAAKKLEGWPLYALALGPLFALAFLALAIGQELREYEAQLANWQAQEQHVQALANDQAQAWAHERAQARQAADQARIEAQAKQELEQERMRIEAQTRIELERVRLEARQARRAQPAQVAQVAPVASAQPTGNRARVLEIARNEPGATQETIAQRIGITRQAVGKHLVALEQSGLLRRNAGGSGATSEVNA